MLFNFRKIENLHIVLWLIKDFCWISDYHLAGMFMIIPTIGVAFYITWKLRKRVSELVHNLAVCMWILANSVWMTGEFFFNDTTRTEAKVFFILGLLIVLFYYIYLFFKPKRHVRSNIVKDHGIGHSKTLGEQGGSNKK